MSSCEEVKVIDDATKLTIPDLVSYLEGKFRPAEFDKVKRALLNREETMALENHKLQQNFEDSLLARLLLEDESNEQKREIEELTETNLKLAEENRVVKYENGVLKEREKRGEERYEKVKGELKRLEEEGGKGKVLELQNRVRDLEIEKGKVDGKLEAWRERYWRITSRVLLLEEQVNVLKAAVEMADEVEREKEKPSSADSGCGNGNLAGGVTGDSNRHGDLKIGASKEVSPKNTTVPALKCIIEIPSDPDDEPMLPRRKRKLSASIGSTSSDSTSDSEYSGEHDGDVSSSKAHLVGYWGAKKWKVEQDLIAEFERHPELCMRAVCALFRDQHFEKIEINGEFNASVASRGIALAKFLIDGNPRGRLSKTTLELQGNDKKGIDDCRMIAILYSKQLFKIYRETEDPYFLPDDPMLSEFKSYFLNINR